MRPTCRSALIVQLANDLAIHPDHQRILAKRCTNSTEWDSDHSPFLSQPDRLASTLHALAADAATL